jgi:hypothetical protein
MSIWREPARIAAKKRCFSARERYRGVAGWPGKIRALDGPKRDLRMLQESRRFSDNQLPDRTVRGGRLIYSIGIFRIVFHAATSTEYVAVMPCGFNVTKYS